VSGILAAVANGAHVVVRARTSEEVSDIGIGFNPREGSGSATDAPYPFRFSGDDTPVVRADGLRAESTQVDDYSRVAHFTSTGGQKEPSAFALCATESDC
jgi:hypothetical protein